MREPSQGNHRRYAEVAAPSWATAWNWWGPAMASSTDWNAKLQENCVAFSEDGKKSAHQGDSAAACQCEGT